MTEPKNLLLRSLDENRATYQQQVKACRKKFTKKSLHDLRISMRRLLAMLTVVDYFIDNTLAGKLSNSIKKQLDGFGDLRDLQVMSRKVAEHLDDAPALAPFQSYLKKHKKREKRAAEKIVKDIHLKHIRKSLRKIDQTLETLAVDEVQDKLPQAVDSAYLTVMQRYGEIDPQEPVTIHHLRVAFKRFHYMVEAAHDLLPGFPSSQLQAMQEYQTRMGDVHDAQVILEALTRFADRDDSYDPEAVRHFFEQEFAEALTVYLKSKEEVFRFWRATPLTAFPWEIEPTEKEAGG